MRLNRAMFARSYTSSHERRKSSIQVIAVLVYLDYVLMALRALQRISVCSKPLWTLSTPSMRKKKPRPLLCLAASVCETVVC